MPHIPEGHEQVNFIAPSDLVRELRILVAGLVPKTSIKALLIEAVRDLLEKYHDQNS